MGASIAPSEGWTLPAVPSSVRELRRRAADFASAVGASEELARAVALAVSETVTNAVVHAYAGTDPGQVSVSCRADGGQVIVEVADEGAGMAARDDSPGLGHGLAAVGALAQALDITPGPGGRGTTVRMSFAAAGEPPSAPGLEPLCALALETVADVSCLDVVSGGVLRRATAEVAGDPALTTWLRGATPPAKPGTATWAALRDGGARLVVHDPTVPRSPGGTGERLGLTWWVAVPIETADGAPAALWGLGGREGGRPVPSQQVIDLLADAARADLAAGPQRGALRARLALADEFPAPGRSHRRGCADQDAMPRATTSDDDQGLIAALCRGDADAFAALVDRHSSAMIGVALAYVPSRAAAEEVVQETWIAVLRGIDRFEGRSSLKTWIFRILVNLAMRSGARERRSLPFSALARAQETGEPSADPDRFLPPDHELFPGHWAIAPTPWPTPEEGLLAGETREVIAAAVAALPEAQRTVIALRDVEGWSSEEVCEALGISAGNQRLLLHRARSRVRDAIEAYHGAVEEIDYDAVTAQLLRDTAQETESER